MLAVLRPADGQQARRQLQALQAAGLRHVELAATASDAWVELVRALVREHPGLALGAASVRQPDQLEAAMAAGLGYAVSPILDRTLLERAAAAGFPLVPGVFSPSELQQAIRWGAPLVKLYPAHGLGPAYWASLRGPMGPLPFAIAAGGLGVGDVEPWLAAGVDAVALGSRLFADGAGEPALDPALAPLLVRLG